ncbi:MAG: 30S ribosomal protein S4 [Patescibacteria group bacterium]
MQSVKEKKERALGVKLFLKAERCNSPKCVMVRKPYRPGVHGKRSRPVSEYGKQLHEKQKVQLIYGLNNKQLQNLFRRKEKENIILDLEKRLDRVVFLLGFAASPRVARQFVSHGHILVNGRKVTIPSYRVKMGDALSIRPESGALRIFEEVPAKSKQFSPPEWLKINKDELKGECVREPEIQNLVLPFDINLVGQFYSR